MKCRRGVADNVTFENLTRCSMRLWARGACEGAFETRLGLRVLPFEVGLFASSNKALEPYSDGARI